MATARVLMTPTNLDGLRRRFNEGKVSINDLNLIVSVILDNADGISAMDKEIGETAVGIWKFSSNTSSTPPPVAGEVRLNNAKQDLATEICMNEITSGDGKDTTNFIKSLAEGDTIYMQQKNDNKRWFRAKLTMAPERTTCWKLMISITSYGGPSIQAGEDTIIRVHFG